MAERLSILHHLAVLGYCRAVLDAREKDDPCYRWLWRVKKKVTVLLIKGLEGSCPPPGAAAAGPLTQEQQQRTLAKHPLLLGAEAHVSQEPFHETAEWFAEIKRKVERFMAAQYEGRF